MAGPSMREIGIDMSYTQTHPPTHQEWPKKMIKTDKERERDTHTHVRARTHTHT